MVPSFKNTASIFPEISFIQYFTIFSCKQYDVITDLICIIKKRQYLSNEKKDISKRKTPFFCILKGLSNKQKIFSISHALQGWFSLPHKPEEVGHSSKCVMGK